MAAEDELEAVAGEEDSDYDEEEGVPLAESDDDDDDAPTRKKKGKKGSARWREPPLRGVPV